MMLYRALSLAEMRDLYSLREQVLALIVSYTVSTCLLITAKIRHLYYAEGDLWHGWFSSTLWNEVFIGGSDAAASSCVSCDGVSLAGSHR